MIIIKKLYLLLLFVCVLLASSNIVNAKESKYVNDNGVEFKNSEIVHLKKIGLTNLDLKVLTLEEKIDYLEKKVDKVYKVEKYLKKEKKVKIVDGIKQENIIETEISEEEANLLQMSSLSDEPAMLNSLGCGPSSTLCFEDGGDDDSGTPNIGDTYYDEDVTDISVRKLTLSAAYNYDDDQMFVRVVIEWYVIPNDRGWDIISISHSMDEWYIETENVWDPIENAYKQKGLFTGKQIYDWTEYNESNYDYFVPNSQYGDTETFVVSYDQNLSSDYYKQDFRQGIALKQNLKDNDTDYYGCDNDCSDYDSVGYNMGHVVTGLQLSLEANFHNIDNNSFGLFYGGAKHQVSYGTIDISELSFTYQRPYVTISDGFWWWAEKYEEVGLGADLIVPIN